MELARTLTANFHMSPLPFRMRLRHLEHVRRRHEDAAAHALERQMMDDVRQDGEECRPETHKMDRMDDNGRHDREAVAADARAEATRQRRQRMRDRENRRLRCKLPAPIYPPPAPNSGLAAYAKPLWPPPRRRRRQRGRRHLAYSPKLPVIPGSSSSYSPHSSQSTVVSTLTDSTSYSPNTSQISTVSTLSSVSSSSTPSTHANTRKRQSAFLWLPFFRRRQGGFTEEGPSAARAFYSHYTGTSSFAFNNCGLYYIEGPRPGKRFIAVALDLDQAFHRMIGVMRQHRAVPRLQQIYDESQDERDLKFVIVKRLHPFKRRIVVDKGTGKKRMVRTPVSYDKFVLRLWTTLKGMILQNGVGCVQRGRVLPGRFTSWRRFWRAETAKRHRMAIRIQVGWRRRQGGIAKHLTKQARRIAVEENKAVRRIQHWWNVLSGSYAAKMKARAKMQQYKEEQEEHYAAIRIQLAWRRRQGGLALHLKRQAKRIAAEEDKAARKLQVWWSRVTGSFGAKMKARAEMQMMKEDRAVRRIQHWWNVLSGSYAAKVKTRAELELVREERVREEAARKIAHWYLVFGGLYAARVRANAKIHADLEEAAFLRAVISVQLAYRKTHGKLAYHMASAARREAEEEIRRREQAAVYLQFVWRKARGQLAFHLIRQARKRVKRRRIKRRTEVLLYPNMEASPSAWSQYSWQEHSGGVGVAAGGWEAAEQQQEWVTYWDDTYQAQYYHNTTTGETSWEAPSDASIGYRYY